MQNKITDIINNCSQNDSKLIFDLSVEAAEVGNAAYREALCQLVGKDFPPEKARHYWDEALTHREKILTNERQGSALRPALLDYLHHVVHELRDPRIVEANDLATIKNASVTDRLTSLFNQTYFNTFLDKICHQRRPKDSTSGVVLLLDLDHFKQYTDRCGPLPGDKALQKIAKILLHCIRKGDLAARYGDDEFAILLNQVTRDQGYSIANRIRSIVDKAEFQGQHLLDQGNLTISIGLAYMGQENITSTQLTRRADEELNRAKLFRNAVSPHHSEVRKSSRVQRQSIVEFALLDDAIFSPAMSHDVSDYGMALDCDRRLEKGTELKLRFRHPFWPSNRQVLASIKHIDEQTENGLFRLGLKFNPEQMFSHQQPLSQGTF